MGQGNGTIVISKQSGDFLSTDTIAAQGTASLRITLQNIHFKGFSNVISLRTKNAVVKIRDCSFELIFKSVMKIHHVKSLAKEQIKFEMQNSTVRNCSLFMNIKPIGSSQVTIIGSSFIGTVDGIGRHMRGLKIKNWKDNCNFTLSVNSTIFVSMLDII